MMKQLFLSTRWILALRVMGHSMGGFTAAGVLTNPQLKAMVSFNGSCAWLKMEEQFLQQP